MNCKTNSGDRPLHLASSLGLLDILLILVERGAEPQCRDNEGKTPLHLAVMNNYNSVFHMDVIRGLLDWGANVDCQDCYGLTPLHIAISNRASAINSVRLLLEMGANIHVRDNCVRTPLVMACEQGLNELEVLIVLTHTTMLYSTIRDNPTQNALDMLLFLLRNYDCNDQANLPLPVVTSRAGHGTS